MAIDYTRRSRPGDSVPAPVAVPPASGNANYAGPARIDYAHRARQGATARSAHDGRRDSSYEAGSSGPSHAYGGPGFVAHSQQMPSPSQDEPPARQDPVAQSTAAALRPPSAEKRTPSLVTAASQLRSLTTIWQQDATAVGVMATSIVADYAAVHPDLSQAVAALAGGRDGLNAAFVKRFGSASFSTGYGSAMPASAWLESAEQATDRIMKAPVPWTDKGRRQLKGELDTLAQSVLGSYDATLRQFCIDMWQLMASDGAQRARRHQPTMLTGRPDAVPPPPIGPPTKASADTVITGPGPLNIYLGTVCPDGLSFGSSSSRGYESTTHQATLAQAELPLVIDLDRAGGVVVDDPSCLETAVLNLLTALPANQLAIRAFDQKRGGDSAKFLYGLGDATEKVLGGLPATSERQLDELLQGTEEHITFDAQRFLQGEHATLTEYNQAAGEVAEPYRLLILYDFPAGFYRAGHEDVDQLDRLARIVHNGPRCGVFTLIAASGQGSAPRVTDLLPEFLSGRRLPSSTLAKLQSWGGWVDLPEVVPTPRVHGDGATFKNCTIGWRFDGARPPKADVVGVLLDTVKRSLATADDVKVTPQRVLELAAQEERAQATTMRSASAERTPDLYRPETWWRGVSTARVAAHFGRIGARQVADLVIDSEVSTFGALIGGRPGSGKSVLIHAMIMSLALEYSPSELELYLIDFKEGVEFKQYAEVGLPQARLIAIEAERDFGLSVLTRAQQEYQDRAKLFPSGVAKSSEYRERTGHVLPRYVVIIDEFQQLFSRDDKLAQEAAATLEDLLRKGRAFGVHVVLASQSLAGMAALGKHVIGLIPTRIALQSNEADSRLILGEDNPDAQTLTRAGEGILNRSSGFRDANHRFQAALWDSEVRKAVLAQLVDRAAREGGTARTAVFEGHRAAEVSDLARVALMKDSGDVRRLDLPLGLPLILDPDPYRAQFRRAAGSNLLVVDEHGAGTLAVLLASVGLRGIPVEVIDYAGDDDEWAPVVEDLEYFPGVTVERRRGMRAVLNGLAETVESRHESNSMREQARILVIAGMGRARDFDPGDYDDESASRVLGAILRDGPEVGIHTVMWFENASSVRKRLGGDQLNECGLRMIGPMARDESSELADTPDGAYLKPGQAIVADVDRSTTTKVRRFASPPAGWLSGLRADGEHGG